MNWPGLLFTFVIAMATRGLHASTFFISAPNVFRVGVDEKVMVSLLNPTGVEVTVKMFLRLPTSTAPFAEQNVNIEAGDPRPVFFRIEPGSLARNEGRYQHVVLGALSQTPGYPFEKEEEVLVTFQAGFVFVQTDKPIYTPNQKVITRVMSMDQEMRPSDRTLHVEVMNPNGISVTRFKSTQAAPNGFLTGEFKFPSHPMEGIWSVTAFYGHQFLLNSTVTFEVKEYVLPTFSVKLTPPKYILEGASSINTTISAQYVFRKPVVGRYLYKFGVVDTDGTVIGLGDRRGSLDSHGMASVNLTDLDNVLGADWFDLYLGSRFHAEAIVFETATSFSEKGVNTSALFVSSPYKISASRTVQYFKKALTMRVKLDVMYANGEIAAGVPVRVNARATLTDGGQQVLAGAVVNGLRDANLAVSNTDDLGRRDFLIDVPPNADSIRIQCSTEDEDFENNQADLSFEVGASESPNGFDNLVIVSQNQGGHKLTVDESVSFVVQRTSRPEEVGVDLHFMCVTAGKIILKGVNNNVGNNPVLGPFTVTQDMVPSSRLIAYYVTSQGHVVSDSILLEVEERCNGQVSLNFLPERRPPLSTSYIPNQPVEIRVQAPPSSHVGLLAVDKAVYLLRNKDRLTKQKMFDRMRSYDMGCGPGGGQTTSQIFKDSGMTVLTNALLDVSTRQGIECDDITERRKRTIDSVLACNDQQDKIQSCLAQRPNLAARLQSASWSCLRRAGILKSNCNLTATEKNEYEVCCRTSGTFAVSGRGLDNAPPEAIPEDVTIREDFRETWFFDLIEVPDNGEFLHPVSTPSSITEWQMTAVSISPTFGMCVADDTVVHVFKTFFVQLHMPYSVVRLEQTQIVVNVFNYGFEDMEVTVSFTAHEALCTSQNTSVKISVAMENSNSATFNVRPIEAGEFPITVSAGPGRTIRDIVRKKLRVVPQGKTVRRGRSVTLNPSRMIFEEQGGDPTQAPDDVQFAGGGIQGDNVQTDLFLVTLPEDSIPDTEACNVNVIGNILGTIATDPINNLERLVRRPSGCGEQTMIRLAPTLFVYKYLQLIDSDTADLEERIYDYLADGVQRELTYRQDNGAYAAWKQRAGSTWLTAFVVKVFSQVSQFTYVDAGHVEGSINWLIDTNQQESGAFRENLAVIHQEMIGAVRGDISRTAFVLISFLEGQNLLIDSTQKITDAILKATQYLEGQVPNLVRVYDKAIVTYALALAGSAQTGAANNILKESANLDQDSGAVNFDPNPQNYGANPPYWLNRRPSAISVEASAYALLAQMVIGDYDYAGRIAIWLSKQQNYDGGFVSTQDTVVTLQALAKYAERPAFRDIDMSCDVIYPEFRRSHHIVNDNARVRSEFDVTPSIGKDLQIRSTGQGVAKANVELLYNTKRPDGDTCPFHIEVNATETGNSGGKISRLDISVCTRYRNTLKSTHMSIIDVGLYSGFNPIIQDLQQIANGSDLISIYEIGDRSVIFYADKIPSDANLCFTFSAKSESVVGNVQPVAINVYDYYDPDESCTIFYQPGENSPLLTTLCSDNECICSSHSLSYCSTIECGQEYQFAQLEASTCASQEGYALKITIVSQVEQDGFKIYNFTVNTPIKTGVDNVAGTEQRQLYIDAACECPRLRDERSYLLVGQKGLKFTTRNNEEGFKYKFGVGSMVEFWPNQRKSKNAAKFDKLVLFQATLTARGCANENSG